MAHGGGCHRLPGFAHFESSLNTVSSPLCSFEQLDLRFGPEDVGLPNTGLDLSCVNGLDLSSASYEGLNLSQQCLNLSNSGTRGSQSSQNNQKQQQQQQNGAFATQPEMVLNLSTQIGLNLTRPNVMGYPILEQGISETFDATGQEGSGFGYYGDYSSYPSYPVATSTLCQMEEQRCSPLNLERRSSPLNLAVVPGVSGARKRKPTPGQAQSVAAGKLMPTQANYSHQQDFTCNNQVYDYRIPNKLTAFYNQQSNQEVKRQVVDTKQEGQKDQSLGGAGYQADIEVELAQHGDNELFFSDLQFQQESAALQGNTFAPDLNIGLQSGGKGQGVEYNNRKEERSSKKLDPKQQQSGGKGKQQGGGKQLQENTTNESNPAHATFPFSDASYPDLNYSYTDALNFAAEALDANNSTSTNKSFSQDFSHTVVTSVKTLCLQKPGSSQNETVSCLNKVRFFCSSCSLEFSSSVDMNKHMDGHNKALNAVEHNKARISDDQRKVEAVSGGSKISNVDPPQHKVSTKPSYNCSLCKTDFAEESQLLSHNKMHHEGGREKKTQGGVMSLKDFDTYGKNCQPKNLTKKVDARQKSGRGPTHSLKYEVKIKSQEEIQKLKEEMSREPFPYQCVTCSKKFAERAELLQHMDDHNAMKPFKCNICALGFTYMSAKKRHEKTHTNEKPFQCKECMRTFHRKSDLTTHSRAHNRNKRRHSCEQCGQMFPTENQLKEHNCSAKPSKQLKCEVCPSVLATKVEWGVHMWRHTKNSSYIITSEDDPLPRIGSRRLAETSCLPTSDDTSQPLNLNMQVLQA